MRTITHCTPGACVWAPQLPDFCFARIVIAFVMVHAGTKTKERVDPRKNWNLRPHLVTEFRWRRVILLLRETTGRTYWVWMFNNATLHCGMYVVVKLWHPSFRWIMPQLVSYCLWKGPSISSLQKENCVHSYAKWWGTKLIWLPEANAFYAKAKIDTCLKNHIQNKVHHASAIYWGNVPNQYMSIKSINDTFSNKRTATHRVMFDVFPYWRVSGYAVSIMIRIGL
jgi:hypothetical protein